MALTASSMSKALMKRYDDALFDGLLDTTGYHVRKNEQKICYWYRHREKPVWVSRGHHFIWVNRQYLCSVEQTVKTATASDIFKTIMRKTSQEVLIGDGPSPTLSCRKKYSSNLWRMAMGRSDQLILSWESQLWSRAWCSSNDNKYATYEVAECRLSVETMEFEHVFLVA
jgi:hypothetical protein